MENHDLLEKLILLKRCMNSIYSRIGIRGSIGRTDLIILMLIGENNEISPGRLSEITGFSKSLITVSITNLERAGLIKRKRASDRRRIEIIMTRKGLEKYNRIKEKIDRSFENLMSKLSEEEKITLEEGINNILKIFEKLK